MHSAGNGCLMNVFDKWEWCQGCNPAGQDLRSNGQFRSLVKRKRNEDFLSVDSNYPTNISIKSK